MGERSRDKGQQVSGELAVENKIIGAANERGKDAKENAEKNATLSDDALDDLMRRNRDIYSKGKS